MGLLASQTEGFTLVELVTVIILISVLSAIGIGLFARSSSFSPLLATQQLESATLLAQQAALAGNPDRYLNIKEEDGELVFIVWDEEYPPTREFSVPSGGTDIYVNDAPLPITVGFNKFGAPSDPTDRQFLISGESEFLLCLNALGAVYRGEC